MVGNFGETDLSLGLKVTEMSLKYLPSKLLLWPHISFYENCKQEFNKTFYIKIIQLVSDNFKT